MNNIQDHIPKSLDIKAILASLKKILWLVLLVLIAFNIALFYFLDGIVYFIALIAGNILFFWGTVPVVIWVGKSMLINTGTEAAQEVKEKFSKENVIKVVKKDV